MLELKNITKVYPAGGETVEALKGVDLQFRESEFVSILGPSGCGKTTMLNIIGGLDQYTSGDLVINGRSTKDYKDRDWDTYRNHSVGFVFQSYNLIPHQTVLQNVEIALTLSGVSKSERRRRAKEALAQVGLTSQLHKRPSEMSGGQMQRVAIARAIVNDPDIILADEPTGALDTETSIQVMDILKKIAGQRLVVMVTHNPELAEKYSTRIIRVLDGRITGDSAPLTQEEAAAERARGEQKAAEEAQKKRPAMSFATSFGLSLKNLFTKKGRTLLTSFAGSIGIIGIALIYAVSQGTTNYIDSVQEQTLSSYPLTIQAREVSLSSVLQTFMGRAQSVEEHENNAVYEKAMFYEMVNALSELEAKENDLTSFRSWLLQEMADPESETGLASCISGVQYSYSRDLTIYTRSVDGVIIQSDSSRMMQDIVRNYMGAELTGMSSGGGLSSLGLSGGSSGSFMQSRSQLWQEMLPGENGRMISPVIESQYDLVYGNWPSRYDEVVLVLDENNELNDMVLYAIGLKSEEEIRTIVQAAKTHEPVSLPTRHWSYEEICALDFRTILPADCYVYDEAAGVYVDLRENSAGLQYLYDNALQLHVCGIIRPNADSITGMLTGSICYTTALTEYMIAQTEQSPAVQAQLADPGTDIFTGLPFRDSDTMDEAAKAQAFTDYIAGLDTQGKADAFISIMSIPSQEMVDQAVAQTLASMPRESMVRSMITAYASQMSMKESDVAEYIEAMSDEEIAALFARGVEEQFRASYAEQAAGRMAAMPPEALAAQLDATEFTQQQKAEYYDRLLTFSASTLQKNLRIMSFVDLESPSAISIYAASFSNKDQIERAISVYNDSVDELHAISYTDYVGLMMSSVTTIIDAIAYVLIAFVSVSLVVSSIMIGVITLISVQERTKEIGILRAIGASKKNVSSMFNAETVIIGFTSGALGVCVTWLLCIPINLILHEVTGISNLSAYLPPEVAAVLVAISMGLTLFSGIIPSRSAARKDPVVALRTE